MPDPTYTLNHSGATQPLSGYDTLRQLYSEARALAGRGRQSDYDYAMEQEKSRQGNQTFKDALSLMSSILGGKGGTAGIIGGVMGGLGGKQSGAGAGVGNLLSAYTGRADQNAREADLRGETRQRPEENYISPDTREGNTLGDIFRRRSNRGTSGYGYRASDEYLRTGRGR